MKWMNATAAATSYPTNGKGANSATDTASMFVGTEDNKMCVLHGAIINPGSAAGTVVITGHDGSATPVATIKAGIISATSGTSFWVNLHGIQTKGLRVVCAGAACTATIFFDVGQSSPY